MLTRAGHALIVAALALLTLGMGSANPVLIGLSAIPLAAFLLAATEALPEIRQARLDVPTRARAGDVLDVTAHLDVAETDGLVVATVRLPSEFDLVEGENTRLLDVTPGEPATFEFKVRAAKRGRFDVGPLEAAAVPTGGVRSTQTTPVAEATALEVNPGLVPIRRLRAMRGTAATLAPDEDEARVGLKTTDFRELREYRFGDPPRSVNWKATARLGPATDTPLVNEYEVEGRKAVWFLVDAGRHMAIGTDVENGFELAVAATSGLALSYLDRGYKVGLYAYNTDKQDPLYPDVGHQQYLKVQRRLARLAPGEEDEGPLEAVLRCRSWLLETAPMVVFVTRTEIDTDELEQAIRRIRAMDPDRKRPVIVIEPQAYHLVPGDEAEDATAELLEHLARPRHQRLRQLGAVVLPWNPEHEPLERLLFRGVMHHR